MLHPVFQCATLPCTRDRSRPAEGEAMSLIDIESRILDKIVDANPRALYGL